MKFKKQFILVIALMALVSCMIAPVMAETLTGTLGGAEVYSSSYATGAYSESDTQLFQYVIIKNIEYASGTSVLVSFDPSTGGGALYPSFDANASKGAITTFKAQYDTPAGYTVVTGTIGYQRSFTALGVETQGYQYLWFNSDWNVSTLTGNKKLFLNYTRSDLYNISMQGGSAANVYPTADGNMYFAVPYGGFMIPKRNDYIRNTYITTYADYSFSKPAGIGIQGTVTKTVDGTPYNSLIFILNGTSPYNTITSDSTLNSQNIYVNTLTQSLSVRMKSAGGIWYNSSVLFAPVAPTVTPTPITTIPPGYIQTSIHLLDNGGNAIHGGNINILDVEANVWTNSTSDADGILYVNTLPYHTIDIYGSFTIFPNEFLPNQLLGQETGYEGGYGYWLTLFPYESIAPPGQTSLYVEVKDANTHYYLPYSVVRIDYNGESYVQNTANSPSAIFLVPNNTIIHASASKTGYISGSMVTNSSSASTKTITIELSRGIVTPAPTTTIPPGGTTPAVTVDPNDPTLTGSTNAKGQEMMNWLAMNGMSLVQLCFLVTIMALLGVKFGK